MEKRQPIVVILGSVDHGKTTLLDHIRKTNLAAKEAGGITQATAAYEIEHKDAKITFIDTPGHEAFHSMRRRGCHLADLGILVVAADDGVKPQTKEAIKHLKETETPFIVAINKIDRPNADLNKVKNELLQSEVLLEGMGGDVSFQAISATTGTGVPELLDLIALAAELEHLTYDKAGAPSGFVLESHRDDRRGVVTTVIVKNGILKKGDELSAGGVNGKVKILEDFLSHGAEAISAGSPAIVIGFETPPPAGAEFLSGKNKAGVKAVKKPLLAVNDKNAVRLILRADSSGSLEALSEIIKQVAKPEPGKPRIAVIDEGVGTITDGDIKLAVSTESSIIGFKVKTTKAAENLAKNSRVKIVTSDIVYDLSKAIEASLASLREDVVTGRLAILATFGKKDGRQIIGGKVTEGHIMNNSRLDVVRGKETVGKGKIVNLQQGKKDAASVAAGNECGLLFDAETEIRVGDTLVAH